MKSKLNQAFSNILVVKNRETGEWVSRKWKQVVNHWSQARLFRSMSGVKNALGCWGYDSKNQRLSKERKDKWFKEHYQVFQFDEKTGNLVEIVI